MGNPLDDALESQARTRRQQADSAARKQAEQEGHRLRTVELVNDFLARMARARNPGLESHNMKLGWGRSATYQGWTLMFAASLLDDPSYLWLTPAGEVSEAGAYDQAAPIERSGYALGDDNFRTLAGSMARLMQEHGVA